jgi:AcrR family transcriptional regulator
MEEELNNILDHVSELYHRYGIKSVTMDDVARELGISKKTLYVHVKDKAELVRLVIERKLENNQCMMEGVFRGEQNAIEELIEVSKKTKQMLQTHSPTVEYDLKKYFPDLFKKMQQVLFEKMYLAVLENIKKGKKEGIFRGEMNEEVIAKLHVSRIMGMMENPLFTLNEFISENVFNEIFIYHIRGMANEKGIKVLEDNMDKLTNE